MELVQHVDHQRPEAAAEVNVLLRRDALVAEHQQVVVQMRLVHALEVGGRQFLSQVQADQFGAHRARQRPQLERLRGRARRDGAASSRRTALLWDIGHSGWRGGVAARAESVRGWIRNDRLWKARLVSQTKLSAFEQSLAS